MRLFSEIATPDLLPMITVIELQLNSYSLTHLNVNHE